METDMTSPRISDRTRAVLEKLPDEKRTRAEAIIARTQTPEAGASDAADRAILDREYRETGRIATLPEKPDPEDLAAFRTLISTLRDARLTRGMSLEELVSPLTKLDRNSGPGYAVGVPFCTEGDSLCVVVSRACCPLPLPTKTVCTQPLIVTACPGIKCGGPEFCWLSLPVSASVMSPLKWNAA